MISLLCRYCSSKPRSKSWLGFLCMILYSGTWSEKFNNMIVDGSESDPNVFEFVLVFAQRNSTIWSKMILNLTPNVFVFMFVLAQRNSTSDQRWLWIWPWCICIFVCICSNRFKIWSMMILNLTPVYPEQFHQLRKVKSWNHSLQEIKWKETMKIQSNILTWMPTNQKCQWPAFSDGNRLPGEHKGGGRVLNR